MARPRARIAGSIRSQVVGCGHESYKSTGMWALLARSYPRSNSGFASERAYLPLILCDRRAGWGRRSQGSKGLLQTAVFGATFVTFSAYHFGPAPFARYGEVRADSHCGRFGSARATSS